MRLDAAGPIVVLGGILDMRGSLWIVGGLVLHMGGSLRLPHRHRVDAALLFL